MHLGVVEINVGSKDETFVQGFILYRIFTSKNSFAIVRITGE